jgi:hypothetical protein
MRWRITVRGEGVELRGYVGSVVEATELADNVKDLGWVVMASPAEDDYDPFASWTNGITS